MNRTLIGRIAWKEYRQQRPLLLSVVGLSILAQLVAISVWFSTNAQVSLELLFAIGLEMPMVYALGCGALLFAGEDEAGTIGLLRALPVANRELLIGKVGFAVTSTLSLMPVLWLVTMAITKGALPEPKLHAALWLSGGVGAIEVLALSVLWSLLLRRVLWATLAGGSVAALVAACWVAISERNAFETDVTSPRSLGVHLGTTMAVALAALYAGRRWLDEPSSGSWQRWRTGVDEPAANDRVPGRIRSILTAGRRLMWQERQQSGVPRRLTLAATIVFGGFPVLTQTAANGWHPVFAVLPVLGGIMGVCVFAGDQRQAGFRFFCERGVSPRLVWLSRHLLWGGWLALAIPILTVIGMAVLERGSTLTWLIVVLVQLIVCYAIGQACSLFVRSSLLALVATAAGCLLAFAWHRLMMRIGISAIWAVWPIPAILLFATWLRMPDWVTENTSWRARWRAFGCVAIPGVVLFGSIATYRATEIPKIPLPYDRLSIERPPTIDERRAADEYLAAWRHFQAAEAVDAASSERLRAEALRQFMAATRQGACRFPRSQGLPAGGQVVVEALALRVADMAESLQREGEFDEALELYWALLRFAGHLYSEPGVARNLEGRAVEKLALERIPIWAAVPGQTSRRVLTALGQLEKILDRAQPNWSLAIGGDASVVRRLIELDPATVDQAFGPQARRLRYVSWLMGFEQARMLRLADAAAASEINNVTQQGARLASGDGIETNWRRREDWRIERWKVMTPGMQRIGPSRPLLTEADLAEWETLRRAARIQLALVAWQIDHRVLPKSLDELAEVGLEEVPLDPFSGQPFHYAPDGGYVLDEVTKVFSRGEPCLWSPGRRLRLQPIMGSKRQPASFDEAMYRHYFEGNRRLQSKYELWRYGVRFPIPIVAAAP